MLKLLKVEEGEWCRLYMKGHGTQVPPPGYGTCPFCQHDFVDSDPVNIEIGKKNRR